MTFRRSIPAGLSIVELLVVLVVLGIAAAVLARTGAGQQASYRDLVARSRTRAGLREGSVVLASELRGIAPAAGDLYAGEMHDASLAFRSTTGSFVLCAPPAAGASSIDVLDPELRNSPSPASYPKTRPTPGDSIWLYDSGAETRGADDRWRQAIITAVAAGQRPCPPLADDHPIHRLTIDPPPPPTMESHAPVRTYRRVRYALYRSADGLWYLGFTDCRPLVRSPPCDALQPASGPYRPYAPAGSTARSGLTLTFLGPDNQPTADPLAVTRIEIVMRADTRRSRLGDTTSSDRQVVTLRNAPP